MFYFLIYVILLFGASLYIGKLCTKKIERFRALSIPIGYFILLGILEVGYYFFALFQVPSYIVHLYHIIILIPTAIFGLFSIQKRDFAFLKSPYFYFFIILIFGIIRITPLLNAGDDWFYMPYIMENADTSIINSIQPRSGYPFQINEYYKYQGFYLLASTFYKVESTIAPSIDAVFLSFRTTFTLFYIILVSILLSYIAQTWCGKKNRIIFALISILSIFLVGVQEWSHLYWGSFILFPLVIPLLMILLNDYVKTKEKRLVLIIMIITNGTISLASSALFLTSMLTFSFALFHMMKKEFSILDYYLMMIPNLIYASFFLQKPYLLIPIVILFFLFQITKFQIWCNKIGNQYLKYLIFILPILFFLLGIILKLDFAWDTYRLSYINLFFNLAMALWILYSIMKRRKLEPIFYAYAIFILLFFHPLVGPIVSKYFTSIEVYYRLFYITKNPLIITLIFMDIYTYMKEHYPKLSYVFIGGTILLLLRYGYLFLKNTILFPDYYQADYHYLLREDMDSRNLALFLEKHNVDDRNMRVLSIYFQPREYGLSYFTNVYRYPGDPKYKDNCEVRVLYRNEGLKESDYLMFMESIKGNWNYDYIITLKSHTKNIEKRFQNDFTIPYQNNTYVVYKRKE